MLVFVVLLVLSCAALATRMTSSSTSFKTTTSNHDHDQENTTLHQQSIDQSSHQHSLHQIIDDIEEDDASFSDYGSWGNFRERSTDRRYLDMIVQEDEDETTTGSQGDITDRHYNHEQNLYIPKIVKASKDTPESHQKDETISNRSEDAQNVIKTISPAAIISSSLPTTTSLNSSAIVTFSGDTPTILPTISLLPTYRSIFQLASLCIVSSSLIYASSSFPLQTPGNGGIDNSISPIQYYVYNHFLAHTKLFTLILSFVTTTAPTLLLYLLCKILPLSESTMNNSLININTLVNSLTTTYFGVFPFMMAMQAIVVSVVQMLLLR